VPLPAELFDYNLPEHLVAQTPSARRDGSKLLVVDRAKRTLSHHQFTDLPRFLRPGDALFRNTAAVLPARLHGRKSNGVVVECFLLRPTGSPQTWECLLRPGKKLPVGATFSEAKGAFVGTIVSKDPEAGSAVVRFTTHNDEAIATVASRVGDVPLPPYIHREDST